MKKITINTSHNVLIEYEVASVLFRFLAWLIDIIIVVVGCSIIGLISSFSQITLVFASFLIITPAIFLYNLTCENLMNGQSVGKLALGIKVIKTNGLKPTLEDYMMRWAFRMIDVMFLFAPISILSSEKGQRIGDVFANTTVINLNPKNKYSIDDILSIKDTSNYEPVYHNVIQLSEDDMLLIKTAITRVKKYPNENNKNLIRKLTALACEKLDIREPKKEKLKFLRTLLQDYIVLTR